MARFRSMKERGLYPHVYFSHTWPGGGSLTSVPQRLISFPHARTRKHRHFQIACMHVFMQVYLTNAGCSDRNPARQQPLLGTILNTHEKPPSSVHCCNFHTCALLCDPRLCEQIAAIEALTCGCQGQVSPPLIWLQHD